MSMLHTDGVDDLVVFAIGSLGFAFGPGTIAWIGRKGDDSGTETLLKVGTSGTSSQYGVEFSGSTLRLRCGTGIVAPTTITVTAADDLVLVAATKATGSVQPRFHKYDFSTATWAHEDSASNLANSATPATSARIGATNTPAQFFHGDTAILAVWNVVLSDAEVEALVVAEANWSSVAPVALWPPAELGDPGTIQDTIGTADESSRTGTSITAEDIPWTGTGVAGTAAQTLPALTQAAAGSTTAPTFTADAAQTLPAVTQAAEGATALPGSAGGAAQTLPSLAQAASATHIPPTVTATAAQTLPAISQTTTGSTQPPSYSATSAQTLAALTQTATGTATAPVFTGAAAQVLPALTQTATGAFAAPTFTAVIAQVLPMLTQHASDDKPVVSLIPGTRTADLILVASTRTPPLTLEVT